MGAAGSLNIGFTYGNVYSGVAAFNGPIAPDKCFFYGTCHTYCGLDSFKCEIMWTSSQAAYNPYILMAAGGMLNSDGYYDPVAMAIATLATQYGIAQCAKTPNGGLYVQSTVDGELVGKGTTYCDDVYYMHGYEVCISDGGGWADLFHGAWDMLELTSDSTGWTDNAYFYLDASLYAVSSQGFYPSHNPMTGVVNPAQYYNMKYQFPLYRAETNKQMFDMSGGHLVFMLIACDINDQYGLAAMAAALASFFTGGMMNSYAGDYMFDGGVIHDSHLGCGHCMDLRDFRLAYAFMSDVFATMQEGNVLLGGFGGKSSFGGEQHYNVMDDFMYKSDPTCAYYMSPGKMSVVSMIGSLVVDWSSPVCMGVMHVTMDFPAGEERSKWGDSEDMASDRELMMEIKESADEENAMYSGKMPFEVDSLFSFVEVSITVPAF
jgi:hypothetical protein